MRVGVPKETTAGERRVTLVPETLGRLGDGIDVIVEPGAGVAAAFPDEAYRDGGATLGDPWEAEVVAKVAAPTPEEAARLHDGQVLIAFLQPLTDTEGVERLAGPESTGSRSSRFRGSPVRSRWTRCRRRRPLRATRPR